MTRDRRREPRSIVSGKIRLLAEQPVRRWIEGNVLDVSRSGFRVCHRDSELEVGHSVEFQLGNRRGEARVMWHRIISDRIESGFAISAESREPEAA